MQPDALLTEVGALSTLGAVIRWSLVQQPRAEFVDVIVQDEFNHDVIVRVSGSIYAGFETS